jgi:hypothetical protein
MATSSFELPFTLVFGVELKDDFGELRVLLRYHRNEKYVAKSGKRQARRVHTVLKWRSSEASAFSSGKLRLRVMRGDGHPCRPANDSP